MLDEKLVEKLKTAGFSFKRCLETGKIIRSDMLFTDKLGAIWFYPTLSELIGACGKPFMLLKHSEDEYGWQAFNSEDTFACISGDGEIPEIAVAILWLKLNKINV